MTAFSRAEGPRYILGVTGIRSDYDIMSTVYRAIDRHPDLALGVAVMGAHLSQMYGHTVDQIREDGFEVVDEIESLLNADTLTARARGMGIQMIGLTQTVARLKPDMLLVLGDREESMTAALVGAYTNTPVAHLCGGDRVIGNIDDQVRHAVTKLSHLHFTTSDESYERVLRLGEQPFRVFNHGNPGLDRFLEAEELSDAELARRTGFALDFAKPLVLLIQHVLSSEVDQAYEQMRTTLSAVQRLGLPTVLTYPNSDAGGQRMIDAIKESGDMPNLFVAKNLPRLEFINIMRRASVMIGNSSAGLMEAPLLGLPVVNIGNRQKGRLHADNVTFVPHDVDRITEAIERAVGDTDYREMVRAAPNPYGDGHSAERIAATLAEVDIDDKLITKDITY